jgi:hypothetical protein
MTHLTDTDINGYIHHTLTDAQRETMNRHLQDCRVCHAQVQTAEQLRRQLSYDLAEEMRRSRPSGGMGFGQIRPGLNRHRRWASWRFHSLQMVSSLGTGAAVLGFIFLALYLVSLAAQNRPAPAAVVEQVASATMVPLFQEAWDDPTPYQDGLITSQQAALSLLAEAPIYHIDMILGDDLQRVSGRQQVRYVNTTGQPLNDLLFHLYPNLTDGSVAVYDVEVDGRLAEPTLLPDQANLRIQLPRPLQPGDTAVVEMAFELTVGERWQSAGGHSVHLTQFNPTLAVPDAEQGWDLTLPTHDLLFNAAPAFYRVRLTLPEGQTVISSGRVTGRELLTEREMLAESGAIVTLAAGPVEAFHLTIGAEFQTAVSENVGQTRLVSYVHTTRQMDEAGQAVAEAGEALTRYNQLFGPYPYTELDIVIAPSLSFIGQGAAYNGVIWPERDAYLYNLNGREQMIRFQVAGQWFGAAVAGNRLENPWLADGLAEYATHYANEIAAGATSESVIDQRWQARVHPNALPINLPAAAYSDYAYTNLIRGQAPVFLATLAEAMGQESLDALLADYAQMYRWGGADTAAFRQFAEQHCHCDLQGIFTEWMSGEP